MRFMLETCFSHAAACLVSLERTFGGREQRASSEKFAYANLTNRLTRGLRGIRVVVGHSIPANGAFERLSPQPFSACSVSQQTSSVLSLASTEPYATLLPCRL